MVSVLVVVAINVASLLALYKFLFSTRRPPLPPGLIRLPFVGNLFNAPAEHEGESLAKLGDLMYFSILGTNILYINSADIAVDLLEKRGNIYSDRPTFVFGGEM